MKNIKLFKKIDIRVIQGLVMVLIIAVFIYLFYSFYNAFVGYRAVKMQPKSTSAAIEPLPLPELFSFTPTEEENNHFQLFLFKEKKEALTSEGDEPPLDQDQPESYEILGVVKKDHLFLVIRLNSNNEIHMFDKGMTIEGGFKIKSITLNQVIITDSTGAERVHQVFQLEPVPLGNEQALDAENNK